MAGVANSSLVNGRMSPLRFLRNSPGGETTPVNVPKTELIHMDEFAMAGMAAQPLVDAYRTRLWIAGSIAVDLWAGFVVPNDPKLPSGAANGLLDASGRRWFKFHSAAAPAGGQTLLLVEPVPAGCVIAVTSSAPGPVYFSQTM